MGNIFFNTIHYISSFTFMCMFSDNCCCCMMNIYTWCLIIISQCLVEILFFSGDGCISSLRSSVLSMSFSSTVGEQSVFLGQVGRLIPPACCGSVQGFPPSWTQEHVQGISWPYGQNMEHLHTTILIKLHSHMSKAGDGGGCAFKWFCLKFPLSSSTK